MLPLQAGVQASAVYPCKPGSVVHDERYRVGLSRMWDSTLPRMAWVMLNPSVATADVDDRTVRKCQKFARSWGFGGIAVVNIFALRSANPIDLYRADDPVGPENDTMLNDVFSSSYIELVMAAWGVHGALHQRGEVVKIMAHAHDRKLHVLGLTKDGHPRHPLYVRDVQPYEPWNY